ncbi:hypothetical protein [Rhizobium leguminosarum]|uniref:hypothetical protein n=1 Tax=Rhizobium leguminosarum TaxID=384 RepID=UPI00103D1B30|nr:hypothetical protein [Rhizobium leguminosarum]TBZ80591.1 hypothetical protein E0H53_29705 [Rhizobium leguminosarum bv. viciae]TBZ99500.1 hypothetical protein E0H63_25300 [Rhizobium leguminosarum bv. viciae]
MNPNLIREADLKVLFNPDSDRRALDAKLKAEVDTLVKKIDRLLEDETDPVYLVGNGNDFDEFAARIAPRLSKAVAGAACIWTRTLPYSYPNGRRAFTISQEMIEDHGAIQPTVIYCQSVISDEFEIVTALSRLSVEISFERVVIVAVMADRITASNISQHLQNAANYQVGFVVQEFADRDLTAVRDSMFAKLDDRPVKIVPAMSRWMMARAFGPDPNPSSDLSPKI